MKIGEIRELIRLLDETSLTELKLETGDVKLLLKKGEVAPAATVVSAPATIPAVPASGQPALPQTPAVEVATNGSGATPGAQAEDESGIHYITAPMVGTFYRSPSPDADPYVSKGQQVSSKTVVCIVEAMKLMNEIEAEVNGEVLDVLVENGQLVEYGQPMVKIKLS